MGIPGLLQFIKDASEPVNVKKYRGQTVAVDTYCWLHKGAFSCAEKLAKGEPTEQYVSYCMTFVDMLLSFGVKPILVFDGCNLPSKREVDKARRERRQANLQKGKQLLREGKISEARDCFTRCVNVTPAMAHKVIKAARTRGVDCVVAPYEADAQLAFLNKTGIAQAVITEDSDLLAFGCKKVLLKMDKQGNGLEIDQCHLGRCRSLGDVFTEEKFRHMCILSGCDYLASLYGIGLGKASKLLRLANNPDILKVIRKIGQYLKMNITVPEEYVEGFVKANNTFLYQLVFDPLSRKVVPLNPYPEHIDPVTLEYAGANVGDSKGLQMALGNVDIHTMERIDDFNPDAPRPPPAKSARSRSWSDPQMSSSCPRGSIWSRGYVPGGARPSQTPSSPPRPPSTRGKERVVSTGVLKLPLREQQAKRPREESGISEDDMLQQYLSSLPKKQRAEPLASAQPAVTVETKCRTTTGQPTPRNRFATLLQWRNQSEEEAGSAGEGTRSRFFCGGEERSLRPTSPGREDRPSDSEQEDVDTERGARSPGPARSPRRSPSSASQGPGLFSWSDSPAERSKPATRPRPSIPAAEDPRTGPSGLSALQQFHRKRDTLSWGSPSQKPHPPSSAEEEVVDIDTPPGSPPSQDSAYFSQPNSIPRGLEDSQRTGSSPSQEMDSSGDSDGTHSPGCSPVAEEVKSALTRTKVSGLSRMRPWDQGKSGKIKTSAPARASGLRKKPAGKPAPGKKAAANNENNPGLQATISGLWKNFGFKKESPKFNPSKKGEPMSPVKDNANVPKTDEDVILVCG